VVTQLLVTLCRRPFSAQTPKMERRHHFA